MIKNTEDDADYEEYLKSINKIHDQQNKLSDYLSAISPDSKISLSSSIQLVNSYKRSINNIDIAKPISKRLTTFLDEVDGLLKILKTNDIKKVKNFLNKTTILFKGYVGVRHIDYIGYKDK